jgi:hypothetical protein
VSIGLLLHCFETGDQRIRRRIGHGAGEQRRRLTGLGHDRHQSIGRTVACHERIGDE